MNLARMRQEYESAGLTADSLCSDPFEQFRLWLDQAVEAGVDEPNAMVVSTVGADGDPNARYLLLKGMSDGRLEFYTNYGSAKSRELLHNPKAALTFGWLALHRQVRVMGTVQQLPTEQSDEYFALRPRDSQIASWASRQSQPLRDREELLDRISDYADRFPGEVPRPPDWGGFGLQPAGWEFWQGRPGRLHDRFRYFPAEGGVWETTRLAP